MSRFSHYEIKTAPTDILVTFAEGSDWCRDIDASETDLLNALISAATDSIESMTNQVFAKRTFTGKYDGLELSKFEPHLYIELRKTPLISVTSVKVNGTALGASEYILKNKKGFSRILFTGGHSLDTDLAYPIEVEFVTGYDPVTGVPDGIVTAVKQLVLFWYENRGSVDTDGSKSIPLVVKALVKQYRVLASYG